MFTSQEDIYGNTNVTEMNKDLHPGNDPKKNEDRETMMLVSIDAKKWVPSGYD
jgi:hypothetical protein